MGLPDLIQQLNQVVFRYEASRKLKRLTLIWLAAGGLTILACLFLKPISSQQDQLFLLVVLFGIPFLAAIGTLFSRVHKLLSPANRHKVATLIERTYPDLDTSLLATLELENTTNEIHPTFLQHRLVQQVIEHGTQHDWRQTISNRKLFLQSTAHVVCFTAWFIGCLSCWSYLKAAPLPKEIPLATTSVNKQYLVEIKPGTTELEKDHPLLITARFTGETPETATLQITSASDEPQTIPLDKHLDDPVFAVRLPKIAHDLSYVVQADSWESEIYQVKVFVLPELLQLDTVINAPDYTGRPTQKMEDALQISAIVGSSIELQARFNKPVKTALLESENQQQSLPMKVSSDGMSARAKLTAENNQSWNLRLIDSHSRENRTPPYIDLVVVPNLPPEIKVTFPARDTRVSPLEEALIQGSVSDDFGLQQVGLVYTIPGQTAQTLSLRETTKPVLEFVAEHLLSLERLQVQPDTLISYYLFAEDIAPDGNTRKVLSDMYFMEVRHFEEIFREGRSASSSSQSKKSGGNAKQVEKLAEQQKQIINATWKIIRREIKSTVSDQFNEDVSTVQEAQQALVASVLKLASKVKSHKSKVIVDSVVQKMQETVSILNSANQSRNVEQLTAALNTEQSSYQLLLKLRAREHHVSKNKNGGGSKGGGSSRSQQQMQQLELTNKKQRYETEKQASQAQAAQPDREALQILNRLRELAQRQKDLNEQLKALSDKKRLAKNDQEREEIERQLKRLRERQRELLRNTDEVAQKMDQSKKTSSAKSRRELEQTRSHLQQSSEALKKGQVSRALNSGTRAQQQLDQLKNEFRKKTANQFADAMRSLNKQAEQLNEKQKEISQALNKQQQSTQPEKKRSLRKNKGQQALADKLQQQESDLKNLVEQMKKIVQESEKSEPLLSKHLYDAIRKTRPYRPADSLKNAANFLKEGASERAQQAEQRAAEGIEAMKQGIEVAAESVLGNDLESLKRAREAIKALSSEMKNEQKLAGNPNSQNQRTASSPKATPSGSPNTPTDKQSNSSKPGQQKQAGSPSGEGKSPVQLASAQKGKGQGSGSKPGVSQSSTSKAGPKSLKSAKGKSKSGSGGSQGGPGGQTIGPITGNQFRKWSDRMRDVEEMVGDPDLRSKVAQIRERAQSMRAEFKRHSKVPKGDLVNAQILEPLAELQKILSNEIIKRGAQTTLAPIDGDPVPEKYSDLVRRYYEELGSGK